MKIKLVMFLQRARGAVGYANQLASQQTAQLLQIRSLLVAQQNAAAAKLQADADRDAMQQAHSKHFWSTTPGPVDRSVSKGY